MLRYAKRGILSLDKLYAAVLCATFFSLVVSNWLVTALAYSLEVELVDTELHEFCNDCLGALL